MMTSFKATTVAILAVLSAALVMGQAEETESVTCPDAGGYTGDSDYVGQGPMAVPLRGTAACVDSPLEESDGQIATRVYGPMEAGFTFDQLSTMFGCTNSSVVVAGGLDTEMAGITAAAQCDADEKYEVLDDCGGHATPYHYHETMTCLYTQDPASNHSTRVATALDGNGLYGKYIDGGVVPTDLDACGGRFGVTPDSNGTTVYYYVIQDAAPFTFGCFGPVSSLEECRALYDTCGDDATTIETLADGFIEYDLDCPCFDSATGSNVLADDVSSGDSIDDTIAAPTSSSSATSLLSLALAPHLVLPIVLFREM